MPCCLPHVPIGRYTEFSVEGAAAIHLTGYYMPEYEMGKRNYAGAGKFCSIAPGGQSCHSTHSPAVLLVLLHLQTTARTTQTKM